MPKYLLLKHYRGGPEPHHPFPPMDEWAPEDVEAHMAFLKHVRELLEEKGEYVDAQALTPARTWVRYGGPDAAPVARLAVELGWDVELVDHRSAYARAECFPGARVHLVPAEDAVAKVGVDPNTYALVMTHHYLVDRALLSDLLPSSVPYVGLLGPKQRAEDLLADLGVALSEEQRTRLHGPAGLDIGGEGPEAIALSLLAEVMAAAEGRPGGCLRDRKGPIHEPERA